MIVRVRNMKTWEGNGYYIGRSTPLGNHFPLSLGRKNCIKAYEIWLEDFLKTDKFSRAYRYFHFLRIELQIHGEIDLVCHCAPLPCHGDVVAYFLTRRSDL